MPARRWMRTLVRDARRNSWPHRTIPLVFIGWKPIVYIMRFPPFYCVTILILHRAPFITLYQSKKTCTLWVSNRRVLLANQKSTVKNDWAMSLLRSPMIARMFAPMFAASAAGTHCLAATRPFTVVYQYRCRECSTVICHNVHGHIYVIVIR